METSDSEYFESADEDFQSDSEDEVTEKNLKQSAEQIGTNLQNLKITESIKTNEKTAVQDKINENIILTSSEKTVNPSIITNEAVDTYDISIDLKDVSNITNISSTQRKLENTLDSTDINHIESLSIDEKQEADGWDLDDEENMWKEEETILPTQKLCSDSLKQPASKSYNLSEKHDANTEKLSADPDENMWDNEDWDDFDDLNVGNKDERSCENQSSNASWSGWGNWGVTSLLTTATQGVSTLTNQVSQGLNTVLESGMGIPNPEDLAKIHHEEAKQVTNSNDCQERDSKENSSSFVFGNLGNLVSGVTNITKFVESTSTKVIAGGLDTLETIGKKTMEVLQEGDPGLKKKRAFLKLDQDKPILSQILREAKEKAERENNSSNHTLTTAARKPNYESLFDDHHGLVHLEALEMLSKQCEIKLRTLLDSSLEETQTDLQETMDQVKELCELPDEDEEEQLTREQIKDKINSSVAEININLNYERLLASWEEAEQWLNNIKLNICDENELHQQAIETLAQLTALAVEQFHKTGELLLIKEHRSTADEADSLVQ